MTLKPGGTLVISLTIAEAYAQQLEREEEEYRQERFLPPTNEEISLTQEERNAKTTRQVGKD